jgi:peptide/nickel transport system ATP-binding protein
MPPNHYRIRPGPPRYLANLLLRDLAVLSFIQGQEVIQRSQPTIMVGRQQSRVRRSSAARRKILDEIFIADEPTAALDVTIQAQVLDLLAESKARGTSIILIGHDLSVVAWLADEIVVMRAGEMLEHGPAHQGLHQPRHEYTRALIDAIPSEHT